MLAAGRSFEPHDPDVGSANDVADSCLGMIDECVGDVNRWVVAGFGHPGGSARVERDPDSNILTPPTRNNITPSSSRRRK